MYSRYHNPDGKAMKLPENYSGCAFTPQKSAFPEPKQLPREHFTPPSEPRRMEVAKPTLSSYPPKEHTLEAQPMQKDPSPSPLEDHTTEAAQPPAPPALGFLGNLGKHFPPASGLGFEELLLLGLILLLSQTDQSSDVVLWLALLLFCG